MNRMRRLIAEAPTLIGPGMLAAAWSLFVRESGVLFQSVGYAESEPMVLASRVGVVTVTLLMIVFCLKDGRAAGPLATRSRSAFLIGLVFGACCLVAPVVYALVDGGEVLARESQGLGLAMAAAVGVGVGLLAALWFDVVSWYAPDRLLKCVICSLVAFGVCTLGKLAPFGSAGFALYGVYGLLSCVLLALPEPAATRPADDGAPIALTSVPERIVSFMRSVWWALAIGMIALFLYGYVWNPARSGMPATPLPVLIAQEVVGAWGAAVVLALVSRMHAEGLAEKLQRTVVPVLVTTYIVTPYFAVDAFGESFYNFVGFVRECSQLVFLSSLVLVLATAVRVADASSFLGAGMSLGLLQLSGIAGMTLSSLFGAAVGVAPVLLFVLYLVATFLVMVHRADVQSRAREIEENVFEEYLGMRCARIAEECGLSPREQDILVRLGRGHGYTYIAEASYLSESTVRTHAKNIFRKTGVSSREELLDLIDDRI